MSTQTPNTVTTGEGRDLSGSFAKVSRDSTARLGARPSRRAAQPHVTAVQDLQPVKEEPTPVEPATAPAGETTAEPAPSTKRPAKKAAATRRTPKAKPATDAKDPAASENKVPPLVLWTPRSIRTRMQKVHRDSGTRYLDQVLDALESNYDNLSEIVARANGKARVKGRLFEREEAATPVANDGRVQLTIRGALPSQLAVIDQLVKETGADSRSALCNAVLDATLPRA